METVILETNYSAEYRIITISVASSVFYTNTNIIYTHRVAKTQTTSLNL